MKIKKKYFLILAVLSLIFIVGSIVCYRVIIISKYDHQISEIVNTSNLEIENMILNIGGLKLLGIIDVRYSNYSPILCNASKIVNQNTRNNHCSKIVDHVVNHLLKKIVGRNSILEYNTTKLFLGSYLLEKFSDEKILKFYLETLGYSVDKKRVIGLLLITKNLLNKDLSNLTLTDFEVLKGFGLFK